MASGRASPGWSFPVPRRSGPAAPTQATVPQTSVFATANPECAMARPKSSAPTPHRMPKPATVASSAVGALDSTPKVRGANKAAMPIGRMHSAASEKFSQVWFQLSSRTFFEGMAKEPAKNPAIKRPAHAMSVVEFIMRW